MISVNELRGGVTYLEEKEILEVLTFEHIKMGRGSANIKVKVRNLRSGATVEKSYINNAQVQNIQLEKKEMQFLYKDSESAYFMDPQSYEQLVIPTATLSGHDYLKEGENATLRLFQDEVLALLLPPKITLKVKDTPPGVKGDSASNMYKDAILENGVRTKVPLFVDSGDLIVVDTRDGTYTKRAQE